MARLSKWSATVDLCGTYKKLLAFQPPDPRKQHFPGVLEMNVSSFEIGISTIHAKKISP